MPEVERKQVHTKDNCFQSEGVSAPLGRLFALTDYFAQTW
jgi:hypothetical protein